MSHLMDYTWKIVLIRVPYCPFHDPCRMLCILCLYLMKNSALGRPALVWFSAIPIRTGALRKPSGTFTCRKGIT